MINVELSRILKERKINVRKLAKETDMNFSNLYKIIQVDTLPIDKSRGFLVANSLIST